MQPGKQDLAVGERIVEPDAFELADGFDEGGSEQRARVWVLSGPETLAQTRQAQELADTRRARTAHAEAGAQKRLFPDHGTDLRSIMNKSDQAMYLSKKTGRNRVTVFDPG